MVGRLALVPVQLVGEEVVPIPSLQAPVAWLDRAGIPVRWSVAIAWVTTGLLVGALHLPIYQWHLGKDLQVCGTACPMLAAVFV